MPYRLMDYWNDFALRVRAHIRASHRMTLPWSWSRLWVSVTITALVTGCFLLPVRMAFSSEMSTAQSDDLSFIEENTLPPQYSFLSPLSEQTSNLFFWGVAQIGDLTQQEQRKPVSQVAPLFLHGAGKSITDWDASLMPVFLPEEEALDIIAEEAAARGFRLTTGDFILTFACTIGEGCAAEPENMPLDGMEITRNISVIFVSDLDANATRSRVTPEGFGEEINTLAAAEAIRDRLVAGQPGGTCVIFYDPAATAADVLPLLNESEYAYMDLYGETRELARDLLRLQVRDFLNWYMRMQAE